MNALKFHTGGQLYDERTRRTSYLKRVKYSVSDVSASFCTQNVCQSKMDLREHRNVIQMPLEV